MRDHACSAGEIERPAAFARSEMAQEELPPGLPLGLREDLVSDLLSKVGARSDQ